MIIIDYAAVAVSTILAQGIDKNEDLSRHSILNAIRSHRNRFFAEYGELVICLEGRDNWRKKYFPNYKYKRAGVQEESSVDWNQLYVNMDKISDEISQNFPYKVVRVNECEADDIIAQLVETTQEFGNCEPVMIVSGDKDFAQLQRYPNVKQYSPVLKKYIKEKKPKQYLIEHILRGDRGDGVPNVLSPDNTFVDDIRQRALTQKVLDKLIKDPKSQGEDVYRNYIRNLTLIDLDKTPESIKEKILNTYNDIDPSKNKGKILNYLIKHRCKNLLESAGDFTNG